MDYLESKASKFDAVVFLDDDIYFSLTELEAGVSFLLENKFCGLSPLIINENETCEMKRTRLGVRELFPKQGKISSAGENYWVNQNNLRKTWVTTEWLPGGAVIYNLGMIKELRFSPQLENSMLGGYALGDDVDFSLRANSIGKIGCLTTIQVVHSSSLSSHRDFLKIAEARGRWKAYLLRQFAPRFSLTRILALESARAFWHFLNIRKYPGSSREIYIFLREFLRHLD
jgi:GT2 family glycosyltransferase